MVSISFHQSFYRNVIKFIIFSLFNENSMQNDWDKIRNRFLSEKTNCKFAKYDKVNKGPLKVECFSCKSHDKIFNLFSIESI